MYKRLVLVAASLIFSGVMYADTMPDEALVEGCNACHGPDGISQRNDVPVIAGVSAFVLADAVYLFRDGKRPCGKVIAAPSLAAEDMCQVSATLTDEQIETLAAYYAQLRFVAAKQPFDPAKATTGKAIHDRDCARCHTGGGSDPDDDAGIIAGQWMGYLRRQFDCYQVGKRPQPKKMEQTITPLTDSDIDALLHYYASQQ